MARAIITERRSRNLRADDGAIAFLVSPEDYDELRRDLDPDGAGTVGLHFYGVPVRRWYWARPGRLAVAELEPKLDFGDPRPPPARHEPPAPSRSWPRAAAMAIAVIGSPVLAGIVLGHVAERYGVDYAGAFVIFAALAAVVVILTSSFRR